MSQFRSSLAPFAQSMREPDPANAKKAAREAWHRDGTILIRADWFQHWSDQKQAEMLAEKLYGKRGSTGG